MELLSMNGYFGSSIPKRKRAMKRKRKTTTTTTTTTKKKKPSTTPSPSLPDDLILNIIARLSILYYPTLSLVSKSFRSLLTSPELYKTRSGLGHTERCLYVCFKTYTCCVWFTLCRKPDQTLSKSNALSKINGDKKKSGHVLAKVPIPRSPKADASGLVAVGSDIYNIGKTQSHFKASSSTVFVLDCTTHTWREAPRLPEELFIVSANVLDGKIYVAGRSLDGENDSDPLKNSFEVFDTRTQVWDPNPIPCIVAKDMSFFRSACLDGKFHVTAGSKEAAYNVKEGRWDLVRPAMSGYMFSDSHCAIDNVLYCFSDGAFKWYDTQVDLPKFPYDNSVRLVDYDGKMVVFWVDLSHYGLYYEHMIWCAEIALERRKSCEIWGKVEWCDHVLTVPLSHTLEKAVAATL